LSTNVECSAGSAMSSQPIPPTHTRVIIPDSLGNDRAPLFIEYRLSQKVSVPITLASLLPDQERLIPYLLTLSIMNNS
jgi:hypothetical protein